jgi:hypothetical protein
VQGAECYNNTDGSSYVIINDAPSSKVPAQQAPAAKRVAGARSTPTKVCWVWRVGVVAALDQQSGA